MRYLAKAIIDEMESRFTAELAPKWEKGTIRFIPNDPHLKEHDMPISRIMHKIIMMRDAIRVLEQSVNSNQNLSEGEKMKLHGYINKCYGSMTSFNFLFYSEDDKF